MMMPQEIVHLNPLAMPQIAELEKVVQIVVEKQCYSK